jgi:hypothetical protein
MLGLEYTSLVYCLELLGYQPTIDVNKKKHNNYLGSYEFSSFSGSKKSCTVVTQVDLYYCRFCVNTEKDFVHASTKVVSKISR